MKCLRIGLSVEVPMRPSRGINAVRRKGRTILPLHARGHRKAFGLSNQLAGFGNLSALSYLWGMLRAWQVQQWYLDNHFKDDPALTGIMVRRILMHGEDTTVKNKLAKIDEIQRKMEENHRTVHGEIKKLQAANKKA